MEIKRHRLSVIDSFQGILCVLVMTAAVLPLPLDAQMTTTRGLGMGGAYTALARGVHAADWNPANLGLPDNPDFSMTIVSASAYIGNNSFSYGTIYDYEGKYLTEQDIVDIMNKIPDSGFGGHVQASVRVLSFSVGQFAMTIGVTGGSSITLDKDVFDLAFNGNDIDTQYRLHDINGMGMGIGFAGFSYGRQIPVSFTEVFALGGTLHLTYGIGYAKTDMAQMTFNTQYDGYDLDGSYEVTSALGGLGWGVDIGAAVQIEKRWTVGMSLVNIIGSVPWDKEVKKETGYIRGNQITFQDMNLDDDVLEDSSYTVDAARFSTRAPTELRLGAAYQEGPYIVTGDYIQGFDDGGWVSKKPLFSFGTEWQGLAWLPLRMGVMLGGRPGFATTYGLGLRPGHFVLDFAILNQGFVSAKGSKGLLYSIDMGLFF